MDKSFNSFSEPEQRRLATELLQNPLLEPLLQKREQEIIHRWINTSVAQAPEREQYWLEMRCLKNLMISLNLIVNPLQNKED